MAQAQHFLVQNIDIIYKKDPVFVLFISHLHLLFIHSRSLLYSGFKLSL